MSVTQTITDLASGGLLGVFGSLASNVPGIVKARETHKQDLATTLLQRYRANTSTGYLFEGEAGPLSRRQAYRLIQSISQGQ